jgi:hypothetical protein
MWRFKQNEEDEDEDTSMAAAGFTFLASQIKNQEALLGAANIK